MVTVAAFAASGTRTAPAGGIITSGYAQGNRLPAVVFNYYNYAYSKLLAGELTNLLSAASLTPDPANDSQILTAINTLIDMGGSGTQTANKVLAGPASGSPAAASFRLLVAADLAMTTTGDLIQDSAGALSRLAAVATGNALISGGVGTVSAWGKIGLTTHISGTLAASNGGTGNASYAIGDILQASASTTLTPLAAVATGNALISGGVGTVSSWGKIGLTTHVSGVLPLANGGTNSSTASGYLDTIGSTRGQILYRGASGWAVLSPGTSGFALVSQGAGADPIYAAVLSVVNQSANMIYAGPTTGAAAAPTFRALVQADLNTIQSMAQYTPTFTGFGTVSVQNFWWSRVGNMLKVRGTFTAGTTTGTEARISLPSVTSDTSIVTSLSMAGYGGNNVNFFPISVLIESGVGYVTFGITTGSNAPLVKVNGSNIANSGTVISVVFEVPISGWN